MKRMWIAALLSLATMLPAGASAEILPPPAVFVGPLQTQPRVLRCVISFSDVQPTDYFYDAISYLYCHGIVSGYADGTFRPFASMTRAQVVHWLVPAVGITPTSPAGGAYTFADVPPSAPYFPDVEAAVAHGIVSGYLCGGVGEPCDSVSRPYFRPYVNTTRAQALKMLVIAKGWSLVNPPSASFEDVPTTSPWFQYVETANAHGIVSGYICGGPGEPCDATNRPYFRTYSYLTRGQFAKQLYLAIS